MTEQIKNFPEFLSSIFEGIQILNYSTHHIVPPGENYGGEILAADVEIKDKDGLVFTKNFVAKMKSINVMLAAMFNIEYTFKREAYIYREIIPLLINLQKDFGFPNNKTLDLFPLCFGVRLNLCEFDDNLSEDALILFENLKTQGYAMEERMIGFNLEESANFLRKLAEFHSLPIALKILKPDLHRDKIVNMTAYSFGDSFSNKMREQFLDDLNKIIIEIGFEKYAQVIVNLVNKGFKFEERFLSCTVTPYATLVHHDLWINNFLVLRNNDKSLNNIKVYDFQLASYGSLAHDLIFFLFTSVQQNVFDKHYDKLIKIYYDSFLKCLNRFNLKTDNFSWQSFLDELNTIGPHQISHIVIMMRPIFIEKNKIRDNKEIDEKEMGALQSLNKEYKPKMMKIIQGFIDRKWIESGLIVIF